MIPEEVKDRILSEDLVSIITREGISLRRAGGNYTCCCPFHNEKTPSFVVSPAKNIATCFGSCGHTWNAVTFIMELKHMKYGEALEYLADSLGIQYEKREMTPEEREARFAKDQLIAANQEALAYFRQCYEQSPGAMQYVKDRGWNDESVNAFSIGYAPGGGGLMKYMTGRGWKLQVLLDAGLVKKNPDNGNVYDTFRERIMFPLYSRTGYVAGFNGRYIGDKDAAKYINTSETLIYHKGEMLFGLYQARRSISSSGKVVIVEGNPDAIRLSQIGVANAVAPLGTALTKEQIEYLYRIAKEAIIIGDADEAGKRAAAGHAEEMTKAGFIVRMMELPLPEGKTKTDPDEYFKNNPKSYDDCLYRYTEDYIPWYGRKMLAGKTSQTEMAAAITEIAGILSYVKDESTAMLYLDGFKKEYKNGKIWDSEYFRAKNQRARQDSKDDDAQGMLKEYGFYIKNNCYYGAGQSSTDKRWSNFVLLPVLHIRDEKNARRIFVIRNNRMQETVIKMAQSELVSFTDFKTRTETAGNYVWEAGQGELTLLKKYLYNDTPSADEIRQLGWQKKFGFYAWGNGGLDQGTFVKADKYGILDIKGHKYYLPGCAADTADNAAGYQFDRKFVFTRTNDISLKDYASMFIRSFGDNAKVALCFLVATLFRDIITGITTSFPVLNLFGPKGTGKSDLGHSLTSFFISNYTAPNISNATKAGLAEAVAEVSNAIVHLDEYKNNIDLEKREFLKGLWDGTGRSRLNMDNDKRRETTAVDCGVVMSGQEMPTADIALFSRLVFLTFNKAEFSDEEKRNYEELKRTESRGLTHLTAELLELRPKFQSAFRVMWDDTLSDMNNRLRTFGVEDRTLRNWTIVLAAYRTIEKLVAFPFDYQEMLELCAGLCREQNDKTKQNNELSGFWETVDTLVAGARIIYDVDYRVISGGKEMAITRSKNKVILNASKKYLLVNFKRISGMYSKESRDTGSKSIPVDSLRYYLENSKEFMGTAKNIRFRQMENPAGYLPSNPANGRTKPTTAMLFDYDALKESYDIDLEIIGNDLPEPDGGWKY